MKTRILIILLIVVGIRFFWYPIASESAIGAARNKIYIYFNEQPDVNQSRRTTVSDSVENVLLASHDHWAYANLVFDAIICITVVIGFRHLKPAGSISASRDEKKARAMKP